MTIYPANLYHRKTAPIDKTEFDLMYQQSIQDPTGFWAEQSKKLAWFQPWQSVFEGSLESGNVTWFRGGKLNACFNWGVLQSPSKVPVHKFVRQACVIFKIRNHSL